ncbi:MAG: FAD-dependent oxidoreductase, partial [Planctomycetales bacterium]|nr:FAD-dependent oxidoreductase [Planctomycetales bacterium]
MTNDSNSPRGTVDWDARRDAAVAPSDWVNPRPADRYHLVVIGAGTAGLVAAAGAAGVGARVALIEQHRMGGDCLNTGCVPSKALLAAARQRNAAKPFDTPSPSSHDESFREALTRMRRLRAEISHHDSAERFTGLGVDVFRGHARFVDPRTIEVDGLKLKFAKAIIASGARAAVPDVPGLSPGSFHTNESLFDVERLPESLVIIGGGPIGCEMAQAFQAFGTRVTVVESGDRLLKKEDRDAALVVQQSLLNSGIELRLQSRLVGTESREGQVTVTLRDADGNSSTLTASALLIATGRAPNVENMGLEQAGIKFDSKQGVVVDRRLRTTNRRVFAAGDICSRWQFTHAADFQARLAVRNALFFGRGSAERLVIPRCTYT